MWQRINEFVRSNTVLSAFFITAFFSLLSMPVGLKTMKSDMDIRVGMPIFLLYQLFMAAVAIWLMRKLNLLDADDFAFKNIGKGLALGGVLFLLIAIVSVTNYIGLSEYFIRPEPLFLLTAILFPLSTALLEEVVFRGVVLKTLLTKLGDTKRGIINAFLISAALFAVVHMVHLFWATPFEVAGDLLFAISGGMFLGAIYLRTKTLIVPILLHFLMNLSGGVFEAFTGPDYVAAQSTLADVATLFLVAALPLVITTFVLLRKVEPQASVSK